MQVFTVGEPYLKGRTEWPEGPQLYLNGQSAALVIFLDGPTEEEIAGIRTGRAQFALIALKRQILLGFEFYGALHWTITPFTPHRNEDGDPTANSIPPTEPGLHRLVSVLLVDAGTGIVKAIRATTWEARFAEALRLAVDRIAREPYDSDAVDAEFDQIDQSTSGVVRLVRRRSVAVCRGGIGAQDN